MADMLADGFNALLDVHGEVWKFGKTEFKAVAQAGAYAAYNFVDGNTAVKILRYRTADLAQRPIKGEFLTSPEGRTAAVQRSRQVDGNFSEIEVDEI